MILTPVPLTPSNFAPYGQVVAARTSNSSAAANQGTASRFNHLAALENDRVGVNANVCLFRSAKRPLEKRKKMDEAATASSSSSSSSSSSKRGRRSVSGDQAASVTNPNDDDDDDDDGSGMFRVRLLERHPYSSQMFIPINCQKRWLIVVALPISESESEHDVDCREEGRAGPDMLTLKAFMAHENQGINFAAGIWHHPLIALESATDFACVVYEDGTNDDCHIIEMGEEVVLVDVPGRRSEERGRGGGVCELCVF